MSDATAVLRDINAQLEALDAKILDDDALRNRVFEMVHAMLDDDPEFARKMRFAVRDNAATANSKYRGLDVADLEFMHAITSAAVGIGRSKGPSSELDSAIRDLGGEPSVRAMDTAESGFGSQLVGNQYVRELWEAARRESRVLALIRTFDMSDATAFLPVEVDIPEPSFVSESTANNSTNYGTAKTGSQRVQVDAKKFVIHQMWSGEMEEDSLVPFVPFLRNQATKALAHFGDSLVLNGDTTNAGTGNINLDDADPADTKFYLAFDGIRHVGLVDNTNNQKDAAGPVTLSLLNGQRGRMLDSTRFVDWGHPTMREDVVYVADPETADRIALLDEAVTVDKFGPDAGVVTGQIASIVGHPLIPSVAISKTEADGKVSTTGANNTKGQVVCFNRNGFVVGWRRRVQVETERLPATDQTRIVYSYRLGFGRFTPTGAAAGIEAADVLFNITL